MKITDCVLKENNETKIEVHLLNYGISFKKDYTPTFEEIINDDFVKSIIIKDYGKFNLDLLNDVEIVVQSQTEGKRYFCNFKDNIFEFIKDIESLAEEEERLEKSRKEYEERENVLKKKQRIKFIVGLILIWLAGGIYLLNNNLILFNDNSVILGIVFMGIISGLITWTSAIFDRIRFENSGGFYL